MRSGGVLAATILAGSVGVLPLGCTVFTADGPPVVTTGAAKPVLDLSAGTYRDAGLGDRLGAFVDALGPGKRLSLYSDPMIPLSQTIDDELEGPTSVTPSDQYHPLAWKAWAWDDVVVTFEKGKAIEFELVEARAGTKEGVAIGDPLAKVEAAYPRARCGVANEGSEYRPYKACSVGVGEVQVWFGGDPISTIAIGSTAVRIGGV